MIEHILLVTMAAKQNNLFFHLCLVRWWKLRHLTQHALLEMASLQCSVIGDVQLMFLDVSEHVLYKNWNVIEKTHSE